jgi:pilus assembly protein CpaB
MNSRRLFVLLLAAGAAGVVALMVRGIIGGGTKQADAKAAPAPIEVAQVLVAAQRIEPGQPLNASQVRWQPWPVKGMDAAFIRQSAATSTASVVDGTVARAPIVEGEPVTFAKIVRSQSAGYMAATLAPGMRAVSISVSVASVAGGFIQPNDRVDLMLTYITGDNPKRGITKTVLSNVRVLAIDQAADSKNKAVSDVKTVTLELTPEQARNTSLAQAMGTLSLALRSLGDTETADGEDGNAKPHRNDGDGLVAVLRYGLIRRPGSGGGQ